MLGREGDQGASVLADLVDFSPQVAKDTGPHERDNDAHGMIELPREPERGDALLESACGVAEDPGSPAGDLPAAHAGVVAAIDERVALVPPPVVERHPLVEVGRAASALPSHTSTGQSAWCPSSRSAGSSRRSARARSS